MATLSVAARLAQEFFNEGPAFTYKVTPVSIPANTPTRILVANTKRFWLQIWVNSNGNSCIANSAAVSATFGAFVGVSAAPFWLYSQVGPYMTQEFWAFAITVPGQYTIFEGLLTL